MGLDFRFFIGNVLKEETPRGFMDGTDFVVYLAAFISIDGDKGGLVQEVNIRETAKVTETTLKLKVKRPIHMSSMNLYDFLHYGKLLDEQFVHFSKDTHGHYSNSKLLGERD